jgi:multimeric flavodoxin WrbA
VVSKAVAINGSPRREKGNTARILTSFLQGLKEGGCDADLFYASNLDVRPCNCGRMYCWRDMPGECCIKDDMEMLYPKLRDADILILATPVYVPLPGEMQNLLNRLCPLLDPVLDFREGRTRARFREGVKIQQFVLVSTGSWWEIENLRQVVRIVEELAAVASVEFAGAVLRPHAHIMMENGNLTRDGEEILNAAQRAGRELIEEGEMNRETLDEISRPLISREDLWRRYQRDS